MNKISLNRLQISQLSRIFNQFADVENFQITSDSGNGIGPVVKVQFMLFENQAPTEVDITDVTSW